MIFQTGLAIAALVILVVYGGRRDRRTKSRTASITLASATFTYDGRIMVKPDGTLPLKVICRNYDDKVCCSLVFRLFFTVIDANSLYALDF